MDVTATVFCRARARVSGQDADLVTFGSPDHHQPEVKIHVQVPPSAPFQPGERYLVHFEHHPYAPAHQRPGFDDTVNAAVAAVADIVGAEQEDAPDTGRHAAKD